MKDKQTFVQYEPQSLFRPALRTLCFAHACGLVGREKPAAGDYCGYNAYEEYYDDYCEEYYDDYCEEYYDDYCEENREPEYWECRCSPPGPKEYGVYCPICDLTFAGSEYLATVFHRPQTLWIANMVMHYRHDHRVWRGTYVSNRWGQETYERQKSKINEQAKRQILRKCTAFCRSAEVKVEDIVALQGTTEQTLEVACKKLEHACVR